MGSQSVIAGYITVRTTALAKDCVVARMAKLVEEAHKEKSHTQGLIDKFAKYYIPGKQVTQFPFQKDALTAECVL